MSRPFNTRHKRLSPWRGQPGYGMPLSMGNVLVGRFRWMARLGQARRVLALVVGRTRAECCAVKGIYGETVVLAVMRRSDIAGLKTLEGFLLQTLTEKVDGEAVRRVQYAVDPETVEAARHGVEPPPMVRLAPEQVKGVEEATAALPDGPLRQGFEAWMTAALAAEQDKES